jgi:hypothetical protein
MIPGFPGKQNPVMLNSLARSNISPMLNAVPIQSVFSLNSSKRAYFLSHFTISTRYSLAMNIFHASFHTCNKLQELNY